ncbi:MAG: O-antigen ligase family protein [Verrucomicrobiota bacterium JB023]|nr:O-antigen ligase family protein [Verrucomicrobiota bacterium JB023]
MESEAHQRPSLPLLLGWGLILVGWLIAGGYANGGEMPRLALVLPFSTVGAFVVLASSRQKVGWLPWLAIAVAAYFLARARFSEVWDLAKLDVLLVVNALFCFLSAQVALRFQAGRMMLFATGALLLLGNGLVSYHQLFGNESYAWLRGPRADVKGVSGAFYHRNYLAGFLAILCPLLVGLATQSKLKLTICLPLLLLGFTLGFLSNSRGGFVSLVLASVITLVVLKKREGSKLSKKALVGLAVFTVVALVGFMFLWMEIIEQRGGEQWKDDLRGRLAMAGIAFEIWMNHLWFGAGGNSYGYEFVRLFDGESIPGFFGDAERAHSDYLQILSDYGLIGFLAVVTLLISILLALLMPRNHRNWVSAVAIAVLLSESLRAGFDFNLRILPNFMLFAFVLGGGLLRDEAGDQSRASSLSLAAFAGLGAMTLLSFFSPQLQQVPTWLELEVARLKREGDQLATHRRAYLEGAPEFTQARLLARASLRDAMRKPSEENWTRTSQDWARVVTIHPLDGESLANRARALDELGRFDEAQEYHLRAYEAVGRRENKYGVLLGIAMHLAKRAKSEFENRRPGQAHFLYLQAREFQRESFRRNYERREVNRPIGNWLNSQIEFFEQTRVEPIEIKCLRLDQVLNSSS